MGREQGELRPIRVIARRPAINFRWPVANGIDYLQQASESKNVIPYRRKKKVLTDNERGILLLLDIALDQYSDFTRTASRECGFTKIDS
jgi:hypothetical protein